MSTAFWVCAAITAVSAFVSLGYSVVALRAATPSDRTSSMYASARSLALALAAVVALFAGSPPFLVAVALTMTVVQAADAVIGALIHDRLKTVGPAATAATNAVTLVWLLSQ